MRLDFEQEQLEELSEELLLEEEEEAGDGTWMHLHSTEVDSDDDEDESDEDELSADCDCQWAFSPQRCCTLTLCHPSAFCSPLVCTTSEEDAEWPELESDDEELSLLLSDELQLLLDDNGQEQSTVACTMATNKAMQKTSANFILAVDFKNLVFLSKPLMLILHLLLV